MIATDSIGIGDFMQALIHSFGPDPGRPQPEPEGSGGPRVNRKRGDRPELDSPGSEWLAVPGQPTGSRAFWLLESKGHASTYTAYQNLKFYIFVTGCLETRLKIRVL